MMGEGASGRYIVNPYFASLCVIDVMRARSLMNFDTALRYLHPCPDVYQLVHYPDQQTQPMALATTDFDGVHQSLHQTRSAARRNLCDDLPRCRYYRLV
jgi:hypothetical protein